jgi:hypothetical protein
MSAVRRHLRVYVTAWLLFQAAALSAIVPRDCCAAHRPAAAKASCHEATPLPQDVHAHHHGSAPETATEGDADECSMRGACGGPMAGFLAQLSLQCVLGSRPQVAPDVAGTDIDSSSREHLISRLAAPDSPPPRA